MANPTIFGQPERYMGPGWYPTNGPDDFGGVHTNSGVMNKWYWYFSTGGPTGTAHDYQKSAKIVYQAQRFYLHPNSTYHDAANATRQGAIDRYGECSDIARQVVYAWQLVGISIPPVCPSCNITLNAAASPSQVSAGQSFNLSSNCTGDCNHVFVQWTKLTDPAVLGQNHSVSLTAPTTPGKYTYMFFGTKSGCPNQWFAFPTLTVIGGSNPCNFTQKGKVGTWRGMDVQTREYLVNGNYKWILVTTVPGSTYDKHFPRGANFVTNPEISWTNGPISKSCLGGGDTSWWGLTMPDGIAPPPGYYLGTEPDGAKYFQSIVEFPLDTENLDTVRRVPGEVEKAVTNHDLEKSLVVSPNPNVGSFEVSFHLDIDKKAVLQMIDTQGNMLYTKQLIGSGFQKENVNLTSQVSGNLLIVLNKENETEVKRVIILK